MCITDFKGKEVEVRLSNEVPTICRIFTSSIPRLKGLRQKAKMQ
jgi:hypothetical protein